MTPVQRRIFARRVVRAGCEVAGVSLDALLGRCRCARLVAAREAIAQVLRDHGFPIAEIGPYVGRCHPAVNVYLARRRAA